MFNSDSSKDFKKKKSKLNDDELGFDDAQLDEIEKEVKKHEEVAVMVEEEPPKMHLDMSDFSMEMLIQLRHEFMQKYSKIKYLLVFDKSSPSTDVSYFMISPLDNCTILSKAFKFSFTALRDLVFYRVVNIDGKIYAMGGISTKSKKVSGQTFVYDIRRNSWTECARMNTPRCKFSITVVKNMIYVMGGQDIYGTPLFSIERYDPRRDDWEELGLLPEPVKFHASCVVKNRYIAVSGGCKVKENNFNIYDTEVTDWRRPIATFTLPLERENHTMILHRGSAYVMGGLRYEARVNDPDNPEPMNENSINSINLNSFNSLTKNIWKTLSHPKTYLDRNGCAACVLNNYIYIIGGHTVENNDNEKAVETKLVERFDPLTNRIEKAFTIEPDVTCFDVDCCVVDVDINVNEAFSIDAIFFTHTPLW